MHVQATPLQQQSQEQKQPLEDIKSPAYAAE
jgi:hypothetical protein